MHRDRAVSGYPLEAELEAKQREVEHLTEIAKKQEERIEELERRENRGVGEDHGRSDRQTPVSSGGRMKAAKKVCRQCRQEKPLASYHVDKRNSDGLKTACKSCANAEHRRYHAMKKLGVAYNAKRAGGRWKECVDVPGLKSIREELGLSRARLALEIGCSRRTIQHVETGDSKLGKAYALELIAFVSRERRRRREAKISREERSVRSGLKAI